MNPLTLDLVATVLASLGVITCGLGAIWVLPWEAAEVVPARARRVTVRDLVPLAPPVVSSVSRA